ncbi:hypothetical protein BDZ88DRAFT_448060 [Geranomyces variabilis]|nr:hypothetical protein BDZ88DRAFT_448060 [Geranomyces variabilis]KAJ3141643.1 hypothetical protein HDU90_005986 [Geranomyces variabilis]
MVEQRVTDAQFNATTNALIQHSARLRDWDAMLFLLPMVAEIVFRVRGHHFLSDQREAYITHYDNVFRACLVPLVKDAVPIEYLLHTLAHWISPGRAYEVAATRSERIPEVMRIRLTSAPSGTAVITTAAATLDAMSQSGFLADLRLVFPDAITGVTTKAAEIRANPILYHKTPAAYGIAGLSAAQAQELENAKNLAITLAPTCYAFIQAYVCNASLGRQAALTKHAMGNPALVRTLTSFFRLYANNAAHATNLQDISRGSRGEKPTATAEVEVIEQE